VKPADMQSYIAVGISLSKQIVDKIDVERGDIPRSRYVLRLLEKAYGLETKVKSKKRDSVESGFGSQPSTEFMDT
jgi:hypothetical protein